MTRDDVIKALECCSKPKADCDNCPMVEKRGCAIELYRNALEYIKENTYDVVRCKDCKWCRQSYPLKEKGKEPVLAYTCRLIKEFVSPNHYCSCGERREK